MTRFKPNTTIGAGIALIALWIIISAATSSAASEMYSERCANFHGEKGRLTVRRDAQRPAQEFH